VKGNHSQPRETVHLDGALCYLEQNSILEKLGIAFHKHYRVLICLACGSAYPPADIVGHLRNQHSVKAKDEEASYILSTPETLGVIDSQSVPLPASSGPPVEGIKVVDGFRCCFCDYAAVSKRTITDHFSVHKGEHSLASVEARSRPAKLQAFWAVIHKVYFEVNPSLAHLSASSIWATYLSEEALKPTEEIPAVPAVRPTEVPLLLKHTQWHTLLGDRIKDRVQREKLIKMVTLSTEGENCLGKLADLCFKYLKAGAQAAKGSSDIVLMMMESFPV
jgi:hypothetical protein